MGQLLIVLIIPPVAGLVTYFVVRFFSKRNELEIASRRKKSLTIIERSAPPPRGARKQNAFLRLTTLVFADAKKRLRGFDRAFSATRARSAPAAETSDASRAAGSPSPQWGTVKRLRGFDRASSATTARSAPAAETSSASRATGSPFPQWGTVTLLAVGAIGAIGGFAIVWYLSPLALTMKHLLFDAVRTALDFF